MYGVKQIDATDTDMIAKYAEVPMFVEADRILRCDPIDGGAGGFRLFEHMIDPPYVKTYPNTDDAPFPLHKKWDISNWGVFVALQNDQVIGGCVIAIRTEGIYMLEGRTDMAVLWDIRVRPESKRAGIGSVLFQYAKKYSIEHGCSLLKIETQNVNVSACHFYQKQGCHLGGLNTHAYSEYPEEVELLWYLPLSM